ncbi:unnamed protein product [Lactuca saligna]|uniref:Ubiquitin-like protease family profile domain-containing protein n=1 Tax=Lactuca saligna TaxID=75948 RepID=A0AA35V8A2_LACSI|nr:unnamed protein product [Lactuca saligna]
MVPITYASWLEVKEEVREGLWQYVLEKFVVDPKIRKQTLQSIEKKWRNFKHYLYAKFIKNQSKDPKENLFKPPKDYPFIKKKDWIVFVSYRVTKKREEKTTKDKNTRAHHKYKHCLSRKGYARLINDIMQETGKTEEEIDRLLLWKKARELKIGGYESDVKMIADKIDELHKSGSFREVTYATHDVLTEALGTQEQRGRNERVDKRINKLEDDLEKLKRGVLNVSEAPSCQVGGIIEDVEKEPRDESLDNSCLLAVKFAANVVAKRTIIKYSALALIPIPFEEEFIVKVKDALGHILSWPRHLVIRCSDLCKKFKHTTPVKKHTTVKEGATPLKEEIGSNKKEKGTGKTVEHEQKEQCDVEEVDDMEEGNEIEKKIKKKEKQNVTLQRRVRTIFFGYDSYTYLTWNDFEAVRTMDELIGVVIVSYMIRHWVLGVVDMKSDNCYYLDSLSSSNFNMQLKQIVDLAMVLYATQSGSNKRVKLNWVNVMCPVQPGATECGYYMLRFMKEIVEEGIEVLVKDNVRK